ncbi:MAG: hypothetical protein ACHQU1_05495 [Gemmatimonadales bacterium]
MRRIAAGLLIALGLTASAVRGAVAQSESVRYLPLSSWLTPYVEFLIGSGVLSGLDPLTRPLKRADVARAVAAADTTDLPNAVRGTLEMVRRELVDRDTSSTRWNLEWSAGVLAASDASKWRLPRTDSAGPFGPTSDSAGVFPQAGIDASFELPHLALVTHPGMDNRLRYDPFYLGKKDRFIAGRNNEAYLLASWQYVDFAFGAIDRNWGPPEEEGLFLSSAPYSNDHLFIRLGPQRVRLELIAEQLDPLVQWGDPSLTTVPRYFYTHRLVAQPSSRLTFALNETMLLANQHGLVLRYLNPVALLLLTQTESAPANSQLGADVSWMASQNVRTFAQFLLDDFQIDKKGPGDNEPPGYAFTLGATGGLPRAGATWTALYTRVLNLVYRTPANAEQVSMNDVGLGRNRADYDQLTGRLTIAATANLLVGGELNLVRQGQGDFRTQYPAVSTYADSLTFLTGVVQRTIGVAGTAAWSPSPQLSLSGYLGYNAITNANHVAGAHATRWVWRIQGALHRRYGGALPR